MMKRIEVWRPCLQRVQGRAPAFPLSSLIILGLGVIIPVLIAPLLHVPGSIWAGSLLRKDLVLILLGLATIAYATSVWLVLARRQLRHAVWWVAAMALVARLGLVATPPFMSSDVYRYAWDGHVQAAGINPYLYVPNDPHLAQLRDADTYPNINRLDYAHTIYPPAAQALFLAADGLGYGVTYTKIALLLLEAAGMAALARVLVLASLPPARLLIYAWNPLAIWGFAADGHVDAVAIGLLGLVLLARFTGAREGGRQAVAGAALGAAILVKFLPLVVAPALWRRWGWRLPAACLVAMLALYAPYLGAGWQVLGFLPAYAHEEGMAQGGGFWVLSLLGTVWELPRTAGPVYAGICALALAAAALWMGFVQQRLQGGAEVQRVCSNAALLAAGTMMALSAHYAWYYPWLALFASIAPWRSVLFLSCAPLLLYCDPYHATLALPTLVFVPAIGLAVLDVYRRRPMAWVDVGLQDGEYR
jgi:alpha-1,6-mannosyltransferase